MNAMNTIIKLLYSLFIAGACVAFVASAVWAFYPEPENVREYPRYPQCSTINSLQNTSTEVADCEKRQEAYEQAIKDRDDAANKHQARQVPVIVLASLAFASVGLWFMGRNETIGEGLTLGGLFNTFYGMGVAGSADSRVWMFINVTILLAGAIALGYRKFGPDPKRS